MAKNQWIDQNENVIVSESNPSTELEVYAPVVNMRRVNQKRATYQPYANDGSEWVKAANRRLADASKRAFENRNRH